MFAVASTVLMLLFAAHARAQPPPPDAAARAAEAQVDAWTLVRRSHAEAEVAAQAAANAAVADITRDRVAEARSEAAAAARELDGRSSPAIDRAMERAGEAELAFDRAVLREKSAENEEIRELRARERRTAGKILQLTRTSHDDLDRLDRRRRAIDAKVGDLVGQVRNAELEEDEPLPSPSELRTALVDVYHEDRRLAERRSEVVADLARAHERLALIEESLDALDGTAGELQGREGAVLEADRDYRTLAIQLAEAELTLIDDGAADLQTYRRVFERGLRRALKDAPAAQTREVQGLTDEAVEFAALVVADRMRAAKRMWRNVPQALVDGVDNLSSIDFWTWIAGLFLSVLPLLFFLVFRRWLPALLDRLYRSVSRFASARRNPRFVARFFEFLTAIVRPALNYAVIMIVLGYIQARFPQTTFLVELVTAYFVFRIGVSAAELTRPTASRLEHADEEYRDLIAHFRHVAGEPKWLSPEAARELRSTAREIFRVWLAVRSVQIVAIELAGFTLIGALVRVVGAATLVAVVLKAVSQWRSSIARLFSRVAPDRFAPTVDFVTRHAERWYGLVVVAFALVYIVIHETVMFVRHFVRSTAWFRALNRIVFRARFQRRIRDREARALEEAPAEYLSLFEPSVGEPPGGRLERPSDDQVDEFWTSWQRQARGGYVICSPPGCGKSSELARLRRKVEASDSIKVISTALEQRLFRSDDFVRWVAELLDIEVDDPHDVDALIEALCELEPHALFIDEANRSFGRCVEGYDGFETMTRVVRETARRHFWCLGFDLHGWRFVNYVLPRAHRFASVVEIPALDLDETADLILRRHELSGFALEIGEGDVAPETLDRDAEIRAFMRYVYETTDGNIAAALALWRRSVRSTGESSIVLRLDLPPELPDAVGDDGWFLLSALAQHGPLSLDQLAHIENEDEGELAILMDVFVDHSIVERTDAREYRLSPAHYPHVIRHLVGSNFLYGDV